ncbi:hypothetical protein EDB19DRAFT_655701 [Suillus lakei]|nr:hypothetical protein EDB19DRAFT_655701 [Suillus lakei]
METPSSHPSLLNPRPRLLLQTPSPNRAQESHDMDFMPVAGPSSTRSLFEVVGGDDKNRPIPRMPVNNISSPPSDSYGPGLQLGPSTSSAISSDTPAARLRALLTHPSDPPSRISRPRRNNFSMSETDVTPVVISAREWHKGKRNSLDDDEDDRPISPPSSPLRQRGSLPIQFRALVSTSAASFHSAPDSPLESSESEGDEQTMPPSSTPGTPPLASSASQDGPKAETHEADVTTVRVDEDSPANPKCTAMKTPRPPGAWTVTPVPLKHAPRVTPPPPASSPELTPTASSSWTPLSRANSEPKRRSKPEGPAGNSLLTPIHSLSRTKYLHVRTPAPPGAWMSTPNQSTTQNGSNVQSKFGSIRTKKSILKVRFDVTESEASTAEVEHQVSPLTTMRMFAPDSLPNGHASQVGNVPQTRINGSSQGGRHKRSSLS